MFSKFKIRSADDEKMNVLKFGAVILLSGIAAFWLVYSRESDFYRQISEAQLQCLREKLDIEFLNGLKRSDFDIVDTPENIGKMEKVFECISR